MYNTFKVKDNYTNRVKELEMIGNKRSLVGISAVLAFCLVSAISATHNLTTDESTNDKQSTPVTEPIVQVNNTQCIPSNASSSPKDGLCIPFKLISDQTKLEICGIEYIKMNPQLRLICN